MNQRGKSRQPASSQLLSFVTWLTSENGLKLARLHHHRSSCYDSGQLICGYGEQGFEPLCIAPESLIDVFTRQEKNTDDRRGILAGIMPARETISNGLVPSSMVNFAGVEFPTEADIVSAITRWRPHSEQSAQECTPGTCFCCDAVNLLSFNQPIMEALDSIVAQIHSGEADLQDALFSAYVFGLLTSQVVRERQSQEGRMH